MSKTTPIYTPDGGSILFFVDEPPVDDLRQGLISRVLTTSFEFKESGMPNEFLLQFFRYSHLPEHLQEVSRPFSDLAERIVRDLPQNPERTVALRKLLESKDCAVRAMLAGV